MTMFRQFGFQFYADDAIPNSTTPLADENTNISLGVGENFRIRVGIHYMNLYLTSTGDQIKTSTGEFFCVKTG